MAVLVRYLSVFALMYASFAIVVPVYAVEKPLLVVRYNQENVHFSRALRQAVVNAERVKPDVQYRVVSTVPVNRKGAPAVSAAESKNRLAAMTTAIKELGVTADRISSSSETSRDISSQEIRVFVN